MADSNAETIFDGEENISKEDKIRVCDSCGGTLKYNPYKKKLICVFCSREYELKFKAEKVRELDLEAINDLFDDVDWGVDTKVIECKNCGGKTVSSTAEKTAFCAFCGSQHIVNNDEGSGIKPQGLVPYVFDEIEAKKVLEAWVKRRWLAPNDLKKTFRKKDLQTVYFPYWTFDTYAKSDYYIELGTNHRDSEGKVYKVTWKSKSGNYSKRYDDFLQVGTEGSLNTYLKKIKPFRTTGGEVIDYDPSFLVSCQARKYTVEPNAAWEKTKDDIYYDLSREISSMYYHADKRRGFRQSIEYTDNSFKYIMLPVYISAYEYKNKIYNVVINGQTKKISGQSPVSVYKVMSIVVVIALILFFVYSLS